MLVDVIMMRRDGEKRPREELQQAKPLRAELLVHTVAGETHAILTFPWGGPTAPGTNLPQLKGCRLRAVKGSALMLHGAEFVGMHHQRQIVPQAWWCTILPETERPSL